MEKTLANRKRGLSHTLILTVCLSRCFIKFHEQMASIHLILIDPRRLICPEILDNVRNELGKFML
jgi:hypothetical protein